MRSYHTEHGIRVGPLQVSVAYTDDRSGACLNLVTQSGRHLKVYVSPAGRRLEAALAVGLLRGVEFVHLGQHDPRSPRH